MPGKSCVLITGGAGYIGSHAVIAFREAGFDVVVVDDLSTGHRAAVPTEAEFIEGNSGDVDLITALLERRAVASVIHFAGSIVVPESVEKPLKYYENNTAAALRLIGCCVDAGVQSFVFSSTAAVYGMPELIPVREDALTRPINPYGQSKLMVEHILRDTAAAHDFRFAALRYFNVAGADLQKRAGQSTPNATHLIKVACQALLGERDHIKLFGSDYNTPDGTAVRDYIHVTDLADAHVLAVQALLGGAESMTLNCGYGHGFSVREVLDAVERVSGDALNVRQAGRRPGDADQLVADTTRIRKKLKWSPQLDDLDQIVASALDWERIISKRAA